MPDSWTTTGQLGHQMFSVILLGSTWELGFIASLLWADHSGEPHEVLMYPLKTTLFSLWSQGTTVSQTASFQSHERQESVPRVVVKKCQGKKVSKGVRRKGVTQDVDYLKTKKEYWLPFPHPGNICDPKTALWGWFLGQRCGPVIVVNLWINQVSFQDELMDFSIVTI